MADNDSSIIKPVEGLQTTGRLKPAQRRQERKRRENLPGEDKENSEQEPNDSVNEQTSGNKRTEDEEDQSPDTAGIDYFA